MFATDETVGLFEWIIDDMLDMLLSNTHTYL